MKTNKNETHMCTDKCGQTIFSDMHVLMKLKSNLGFSASLSNLILNHTLGYYYEEIITQFPVIRVPNKNQLMLHLGDSS